ncbi:hypothetical protein BBJ28_00026932, partial [Nothophytophthora sp. Chile5]
QRDLSFDARNEAYFVDYDLMPLMIQENYIQSIMNNRNTSDEKLEVAMHASEFISESDLLNTYVRVEQRWDLLTKQAAMNVAACEILLEKLLSGEEVGCTALKGGDVHFVVNNGTDCRVLCLASQNIDEVIELLDECEITREDLTESMESFKFPGVKRHSYGELDSKAKSTFTRKYNKAVHKSQAVVESALGSTTIKKERGKVAAPAGDEGNGLAPPSDAESEPEVDDDAVDVSKFLKKPRGGAKRKTPVAAGKAPRKAPAKKRRN